MSGAVAVKTVPSVQSESLSKGERTRERILDLTYEAVIQKGFAATSIEELVEAAGITKSGFFYHFRDKNDLARAVLVRFTEENETVLGDLSARARELSDDPLHAYLIFLKLYAETLAEIVVHHPGCLVATITFQERSFDREVGRMNFEGLMAWRARFLPWLEEIAAVYPPRIEVDLTTLADGVFAFSTSGVIMSKAMRDPQLIARQALSYRDYIRLVFTDR